MLAEFNFRIQDPVSDVVDIVSLVRHRHPHPLPLVLILKGNVVAFTPVTALLGIFVSHSLAPYDRSAFQSELGMCDKSGRVTSIHRFH